jgi:hypothetical protein
VYVCVALEPLVVLRDFVFAAAFLVLVELRLVVVVVAELVLEFDDPFPPEPVTIAKNATRTAISARGARKRVGLLLVR